MDFNFGLISLITIGLIVLSGILNVLTQKKDPKTESTKKKRGSSKAHDFVSNLVFWFT